MLRLLADNETAIRRSVNPRLIVETLLLRWAMLDRIVDLAQVLGTGSGSGGAAPAPLTKAGTIPSRPAAAGEARRPTAERETSRSVPATSTPPAPAPRPVAGPERGFAESQASTAGPPAASALLEPLPATLEALKEAWPSIVAEVRARSRFLGEALAATVPAAIELPWITVALAEDNPLFAERLQAQAQAVEAVLEGPLGQPVRLRVTDTLPGTETLPAQPRKLTEAGLKADRLKGFRAKDPSLDTVADALDLEIVD
jgi:DNA polymerase-3 subunit gamma/tau